MDKMITDEVQRFMFEVIKCEDKYEINVVRSFSYIKEHLFGEISSFYVKEYEKPDYQVEGEVFKPISVYFINFYDDVYYLFEFKFDKEYYSYDVVRLDSIVQIVHEKYRTTNKENEKVEFENSLRLVHHPTGLLITDIRAPGNSDYERMFFAFYADLRNKLHGVKSND